MEVSKRDRLQTSNSINVDDDSEIGQTIDPKVFKDDATKIKSMYDSMFFSDIIVIFIEGYIEIIIAGLLSV